jgi:N6-L-threonylcarbamoyladenine synthase
LISQSRGLGDVYKRQGLRKRLQEEGAQHNWKVFIPKFEFCTDNAAMIAMAGKFLFEAGIFADQTVSATARLPFQRTV